MSATQAAPQGVYQSGNPITLQAEFVEGSGPTNPETVVFNLRRADDTLVTYTFGIDANVTNPAPGEFLCALPTNWLPGQTYYEAVATCPDVTLPGEFYVIPSSVIPPPEPPGPRMGPCTAWIAGEDLVGGPGAANLLPVELDSLAVIASMLLYAASGRQFQGICGPVTVRPCRAISTSHAYGASWFTWGYWTSGEWGGGWDWGWGNESGGRLCSCGYDSTVDLAGYPVTQVTQVKIDGSVVPSTYLSGAPQYRLDQDRYLTRLSDPANSQSPVYWPRCQRLDLQDNQPGTWSVSYLYGVAPPPSGIEAARQLGGQLALAKSGQPCMLPSSVIQGTRQGASFLRVAPLADAFRKGATGLTFVDLFIAEVNPAGLRRRPSVFSPDDPYPVRVGSQ